MQSVKLDWSGEVDVMKEDERRSIFLLKSYAASSLVQLAPGWLPTQEALKICPCFRLNQGQWAAEMAAPAGLSPPHASVGSWENC